MTRGKICFIDEIGKTVRAIVQTSYETQDLLAGTMKSQRIHFLSVKQCSRCRVSIMRLQSSQFQSIHRSSVVWVRSMNTAKASIKKVAGYLADQATLIRSSWSRKNLKMSYPGIRTDACRNAAGALPNRSFRVERKSLLQASYSRPNRLAVKVP